MIVKSKFSLFARLYRKPEPGEDGSGDRGDDFVPTDDDEVADDAAAVAAAAAKLAKDAAAAKATKATPKVEAAADDEQTDEEKEAAAAEAAKEKPEGGIPRKRHEAVLAKEREKRQEVERQLAQFQGATKVAQTNEEITSRETKLTQLDKDYAKLMTDGDTEKAASVMQQIRKLDREISALDAQGKIAAAESRAVETTRFNIALDRIENTYPELNEDHADFDKEVYDETVELMNAYKASGRTPTDALQKAVKMVLGAKTAAEKSVTTVAPRVDSAAVADKVRTDRKAAAVNKALDAAGKSPATATAKTGANNDALGLTAKDVMKMKNDKFSKIGEEDLARLRGDNLEEEAS